MIATGPAGLVAGVLIGGWVFLKGKEAVKQEVNSFIMNNNLPICVKGLIKEKIMGDLRKDEYEFRKEIFDKLKRDLQPLYQEIKMIRN